MPLPISDRWRSPVLYSWGLLILWLLALGLRVWGLNRFHTFVFDEVYFVRFAHNYLSGTPFFDAHPPLGKYLIAIGLYVGMGWEHLIGQIVPAWSNAAMPLVEGLHPIQYRWLNALVGSFIPLTIAGIIRQSSEPSHRGYTYGLCAAGLASLDGLLLVESRYALLNIYLVEFGLLAHWLGLLGLNRAQQLRRWLWLGSGICLGAAIAVKWNGLGFWLGWVSVWAIAQLLSRRAIAPPLGLMARLATVPVPALLGFWCLVPGITYGLIWLPHLQLNQVDFWTVHQQILGYHQSVGTGGDIHPYCSAWYTWPLNLRPVAYFYQTWTSDLPMPLWTTGLTPPRRGETWIYDVHAMGNPVLWWLTTAAMLRLIWPGVMRAGHYGWRRIQAGYRRAGRRWRLLPRNRWRQVPRSPFSGLFLYLGVNYAANWLPWLLVSRCLFLYHYMAAVLFAMMALAIVMGDGLLSSRRWYQWAGVGLGVAVAIAFGFWLPIYLGLPLTADALEYRWWLPSWI